MANIKIGREDGLWIAHLFTRLGHCELLCGEGDAPDLRKILLTEKFLAAETDHLGEVRGSAFRLPWMWRPIRFAINNQGRLGIQFKNRITGTQQGMFFSDEHSRFSVRLTDISVTAEESRRLHEMQL